MVVSANNHARSEKIPVRRYPAKFGDPNDQYGGLDNLIVVAAANWKTERADFSNYSPFVTTFAPGKDIHCPADKFLDPGKNMVTCSGTSFGKSTNGPVRRQIISHSLTDLPSSCLCSRSTGRCAGQLLPISAVPVAVSAEQNKQRQEAHPALCASLRRT